MQQKKHQLKLLLKIKHQKHRKRQAAAIQAETEPGFNTLKDKLQEWIEQSANSDLIKK